MQPLDYAKSYLSWTSTTQTADSRTPGHMPWGNSVRIVLDARARLIDEGAGIDEEFYLIAPCRTEWMYRDDSCVQRPSGEYRLAWAAGGERMLRFSRDFTDPDPAPVPMKVAERMVRLEFYLTPLAGVRKLATEEEIVAAAETIDPVVVQTEIWSEDRSRRAVLEYPVRTFNYHPERVRFQIDTGPMLWADLNAEATDPIERLRLAHTVYNRFDKAEFVKRGPWPVVRDGREVAQVEDYQHIHNEPAEHTFFAES